MNVLFSFKDNLTKVIISEIIYETAFLYKFLYKFCSRNMRLYISNTIHIYNMCVRVFRVYINKWIILSIRIWQRCISCFIVTFDSCHKWNCKKSWGLHVSNISINLARGNWGVPIMHIEHEYMEYIIDFSMFESSRANKI